MPLASLPPAPSTCRYLGYQLRTSLPPLAEDDAELAPIREQVASEGVLALQPATEQEATLAIIHVAAMAQAFDAFRLAATAPGNAAQIIKCRAQATSMFRRADTALRALQQMQAARGVHRLTPAIPEAPASAQAAPTRAAIPAVPPGSAPPQPDRPPAALTALPEPAEPVSPPEALAAAERFAQACPRRATLIRRLSRLTENSSIPTPGPAVINALMRGQTPILRKLDRKVG